MPLYDYACADCGARLADQLHKYDDPKDLPCDCGGWLRRQVGVTSFKLKGPGWAHDGYSSNPIKGAGYDPKAGAGYIKESRKHGGLPPGDK